MMKKLLKVTALAACMGFGANAMADDASSMFQWVGTVPASSTSGQFMIVNTGTIAHDSGSLVFQEGANAGEYNIASSSELIFSVIDSTNNDNLASSFDYEIQNLKFSAGGGLMSEVSDTPEFTVEGDGAALVKGTPVSKATGGDVKLRLTNESPIDFVNAGDEVIVQATILVSNAS